MRRFVQADRPITVRTPLERDDLLLMGFSGREALSQLFNFQLDLAAENRTAVPFEKLLGQSIALDVALPLGKHRSWHGIVRRVGRGGRDRDFTRYWVEMVPEFWLWTKRVQSRIFQHLSVPEILKRVLSGLDVVYEIKGAFQQRDYCVQYRESDFDFASRLMEDEGIYYFFKHTAQGHQLVVANTPLSHPELPEHSRVRFEELDGGNRPEDRVYEWEKTQELRSGKYTLWDYCFELPHNHLDSQKTIRADAALGRVTHPVKLPVCDKLEIYEYPGEYAKRFDGIDRGGAERPADLQRVFQDNHRTVEIRMQQEAVPGLVIQGAGTCRQFVSGHKFTLQGHFDADGQYLLTSVDHNVQLAGSFRSGDGGDLAVLNTFTCIPLSVPYRPQRKTPKPIIHGTQTALVVGPNGQEIFTDKYGRVKVQFHWDREGKNDADSSCWVRVAQFWAGRRWGAFFWPRIGQEVVVAFENGDPDQPIIVGSVYNAEQMPPYLGAGPDADHPNDPKLSGIKTCSTPGGGGYNELRFDDTKDKEQVYIHAQRDMDFRVGNDFRTCVGGHVHTTNGGVDKNGKGFGNYNQEIGGDLNLHVKGDTKIMTDGKESHIVVGDGVDWYRANHRTTTAGEDFLEAPKIIHQGGEVISLKAPTIILQATDKVSIKGPGGHIVIDAAGITIEGPMVMVNSSGSAPTDAPTSAAGAAAIADAAPEPKGPAAAKSAKAGYPSCK